MEKIKQRKVQKDSLIFTLQLLFTVLTLFILILFIINKKYIFLLQISLGFTAIITGYNNYISFRKKYLTLVYFIIGLLLLALSVITIIGV